MEASRQLRAVPSAGEVPEDGPQTFGQALELIDIQNRKLNGAWAENSKLKNQLAEAMGVEPEAEQIVEVLTFWRPLCMPGAMIVVGSERWLKTRARLREKDLTTSQRRTPHHLKAAVLGALMSDYHVDNGHLDATTIFRDSSTVDKHLKRAVAFKQTYGQSAVEVVEVLHGTALTWLAERCNCEHTWLEHLRGGPRPDGSQPCSVEGCGCQNMDTFYAKVDRFMREQA